MPPDISWDVRDLLLKLLQKDPKVRLGAKGAHEIKAHSFFKVTAVLRLDQAVYMCCYYCYRPMTTDDDDDDDDDEAGDIQGA